jgi:hypothetical protein
VTGGDRGQLGVESEVISDQNCTEFPHLRAFTFLHRQVARDDLGEVVLVRSLQEYTILLGQLTSAKAGHALRSHLGTRRMRGGGGQCQRTTQPQGCQDRKRPPCAGFLRSERAETQGYQAIREPNDVIHAKLVQSG